VGCRGCLEGVEEVAADMLTTGLFETRGAKLIAAAVTTLAALAVSLLLAPGVTIHTTLVRVLRGGTGAWTT
jgi:hypothetical protein